MSNLIEILLHRSFKITILLTLLYLGLGFAFLHFGLADYSWVIFFLLPFSLGMAIGSMESYRWRYLAVLIGVLIFMGLLIIGGLEGIVCVIMMLPIVAVLIYLGILCNKGLKRSGVIKSKDNLYSMIFPIVVVLFLAPLEKHFNSNGLIVNEVRTERVYPYTRYQVYDAIKSVDTLIADMPFLMKLDLPIPQKCILEKEAVGGLRTCYFEGGTITERITELDPGKVLRMDVIDYQLTGREWLGFQEAIYYFDSVGKDSCRLSRITTYTSILNPRFYWAPLEKIGISQEHDYVFDNLDNDLNRLYAE